MTFLMELKNGRKKEIGQTYLLVEETFFSSNTLNLA